MHIEHTVWVPASRSIEEVFDYIAAVDNAATWDPTCRSAARVAGTGTALGAAFDVVSTFGGREVPMRLEIVTYERPTRLGVRGVSRLSTTADDIRLTPVDDGTHILWSLDVTFRGAVRLLSPILSLAMRPALGRLGQEAMSGLAAALGGRLVR